MDIDGEMQLVSQMDITCITGGILTILELNYDKLFLPSYLVIQVGDSMLRDHACQCSIFICMTTMSKFRTNQSSGQIKKPLPIANFEACSYIVHV